MAGRAANKEVMSKKTELYEGILMSVDLNSTVDKRSELRGSSNKHHREVVDVVEDKDQIIQIIRQVA